jgi:hypothetical protein
MGNLTATGSSTSTRTISRSGNVWKIMIQRLMKTCNRSQTNPVSLFRTVQVSLATCGVEISKRFHVTKIPLRFNLNSDHYGDQGSISPTFWRKAKMRWQSFFCAVLFHQQNYAQQKNTLNFYAVCCATESSE